MLARTVGGWGLYGFHAHHCKALFGIQHASSIAGLGSSQEQDFGWVLTRQICLMSSQDEPHSGFQSSQIFRSYYNIKNKGANLGDRELELAKLSAGSLAVQ